MKNIAHLALAAILLITGLLSQGPPPVLPHPVGSTIGWRSGAQAGDIALSCGQPAYCFPYSPWQFDLGECWLTAYCDPAFERPILGGFVQNGIGIGGTCYWQCANMRPGTLIPHNLATATVFIALSSWSFGASSGALPGAAAGWDAIFGVPSTTTVLTPNYSYVQTNGGYTFTSWILSMAIPNNPALVNLYVEGQGLRFDPIDGKFYLSTSQLIQVRP